MGATSWRHSMRSSLTGVLVLLLGLTHTSVASLSTRVNALSYLEQMRRTQTQCPNANLVCPAELPLFSPNKNSSGKSAGKGELFNLARMPDGPSYVSKLKQIRPTYQSSAQIMAGTSSPGQRDGVGSQAKFQFQGRRGVGLSFAGATLDGVAQPGSALYVSTFGPLRRIALGTTAADTQVTTIQTKYRYDGGVSVIQEGHQDIVYYGDSITGRGHGRASMSRLIFDRNESRVTNRIPQITKKDLCKVAAYKHCLTVYDISAVRTANGGEHHIYTAYKGSVARTVTKKSDNYSNATTTFVTKDNRRSSQGGITRLTAVHDKQTGSDFVVVPTVSSTYDQKIVLHRNVVNLQIFRVSPSGKVKQLHFNIQNNSMSHCSGVTAMVSTNGVTVWIADSRTSSVWQIVLPWKLLRSPTTMGEDGDAGALGTGTKSAIGMSPRLGEEDGTQNRNEQNELNQATRRRQHTARRRRHTARRRRRNKSPTPPPAPNLDVQLIARNKFGLIGPNALVFGGSTMDVYTIQGYDVLSVKLNLGIQCTQNEWMSSELDGWNDLKNMALGAAVPIVAMLRPGGTAESCRNVTEGKSWAMKCTTRYIEGGKTQWIFTGMRKFRTSIEDNSTLVKNMMCVSQSKLGGGQTAPGWKAGREECCVSKYACHWTNHSDVPTRRKCSESKLDGPSLVNQLKMW